MRQDAGGGFIIIIILCLFLLVALPSTSSLPCHPDQRHALLRFKQSLSITGPIVASWIEDEDCCSWDGIACDNSTGSVIGLDLTSAGLQGSIHSGSPLFSLHCLRSLSLAGNDLLGSTIPPEIGMFSQMTLLNLSSSGISGILPIKISRSSKLISLDLSGNPRLEIQDHTMRMLVQNLTQLEELNLGYVNMSTVNPTSFMNLSSSLISLKLSACLLGGKFPEFIFGLPNLQVIDTLWNYYLTGTLPKSKWSPSLGYLSLGHCSFTGAVPNSIGNLSRLTHLDLWRNNLTGTVPNSIGNLLRLTYLDLWGNNFTGEFDLGILSTLEDLQFLDLPGLSILGEDANHGFSLPKLQELYMASCSLSKFPSFLSRSKELRFLYLQGNNIQEIPGWLWSIGIDTLEELNLRDNLIKGSIPPSICQLTSLSSIHLSGNYLTGIIPQCLGNLTILQELDLSNNSLSGPLPTSLANCTSLRILIVNYNSMTGTPPTWPSSIHSIYLGGNNFDGWLPHDTFLGLASLDSIDLSDNKFEGPLPVPTAETSYYSVSNNHFSGEMSSVICNATNLLVLDLSNNSLTGALPDCLKNVIRDFFYLNLRANEFHGKIPDIFHEANMLRSIDLSRNQFEGPLPRSLSHCKNLQSLDVGTNKIIDSFPNWLGGLPLMVISLRSNHFFGHVNIARGTHPFSMARIMDLSRNNFDGNLQDEFISEMFAMTRGYNYYFGNQYMSSNSGFPEYYSVMIDLKGVEMEMVQINVQFAMVDLSSNQFHGEIPKSIGLLKSLKGLSFSHNFFMGSIPPSIGNLTDLESLDLSSNHLMGEIPKELVKLTSLGFLDLSWNNFTGPIPSGGHFNTFSSSSFQGNPGLCGIPLTRSCGQGNKKAQPPSEGKDDRKKGGRGWMVWEYAALGFGTGMGMGISLGYMVVEMGRPLWLVRMVIQLEAGSWKRSKRMGAPRRNV